MHQAEGPSAQLNLERKIQLKTTRRSFLQSSALMTLAASPHAIPLLDAQSTAPATETLPVDAFAIAHEHIIERTIPGPAFIEGMLLGNGDVGVCAVVRPDAVGFHIGKNDCWDIRVSEDSEAHVLNFRDLLALWRQAGEEAKRQGKPEMVNLEENIDFFREYTHKVESSYDRRWPRPWPCGSLWINWDPRWNELIRYSTDPSNGLFLLDLRTSERGKPSRTVQLRAFVDWETGLLNLSTSAPIDIVSVVYSPEVDGLKIGPFDTGVKMADKKILPAPETKVKAADSFAEFTLFQYLPATGPTEESPEPGKSDKDRNFSLAGRLEGSWAIGISSVATDITLIPKLPVPLRLHVAIATPRDILLNKLKEEAKPKKQAAISIPQTHIYSGEELDTTAFARQKISPILGKDPEICQKESQKHWREYWSRSAVRLENRELERIWYQNQYFLACCLRRNKVAPGLFANWSSGDIGTAWHGDYHSDYNCQQVYWGVFSSNHADQHEPYIELCENLLAMSERFAKEKFGLPGAFFPLSSYPVPSQAIPYPVPPWGYQVLMTPWTVQSLWWHYLYTQDEEVLRRVYPLLRSAARFVASYVSKGEDNKLHIIPTVSSENWGFTVDFRLNKDGILDLALTQFLLDAVITASSVLATDESERAAWRQVRQNLGPYPQASTPHGNVWLDVVDAPAEHIYNVPATLAPVFPGEQVGLGSSEKLEIAKRTAEWMRLEGGNDLVFQPLIRARLGMLDLEWFLREVKYCSLPNGVANDRVRQSGGRYSQSADFDFMMPMGFWCENFSLPVVLNECMLQSYSGTIRVFPNTINLGPSRFERLRAVGAFLVSAEFDGHRVKNLSLESEKGRSARLVAPWKGKQMRVVRLRDGQEIASRQEGELFVFETGAGERYSVEAAG